MNGSNIKIKHYGKGIAIIIGKMEDNTVIVDEVVIYDAYCFSNTIPMLLEDVENVNLTGDIYLCGHGNEKEQTIGKRTIKDIASSLVKGLQHTGNVNIHIMACHSRCKKDGKDMADRLQDELNSLNVKANVKVTAEVDNTSVVVGDSNGMAKVGDVNAGIFKLVKRYLFGQKQKKINNKHIIIIDNVNRHHINEIKKIYTEAKKKIEKWNTDVLDGEIERTTLTIMCFLGAFLSGIIFCISLTLNAQNVEVLAQKGNLHSYIIGMIVSSIILGICRKNWNKAVSGIITFISGALLNSLLILALMLKYGVTNYTVIILIELIFMFVTIIGVFIWCVIDYIKDCIHYRRTK